MSAEGDMKGKICMVTGSNSGIGKATALGLAEMGATVVMICRNVEKGEAAKKEIIDKSGNKSVDLLIADLSSQRQIRSLVEEFKKKYQKLHVLINNAGIILSKRSLSEDGIEMQLAVNHLAPFLLTNLLLDVLKASAPSRIINVTSGLHTKATLDFDNLQGEKEYSAWKNYGITKLALVMFSNQLAKQLKGSGITVNCVHPGVVRTNLGRDLPWYMKWAVVFFKSPTKGAYTSIYLATSAELEGITGKYFANKQEKEASKEAFDEEKIQKLWEISEKLTKLTT